MRRMAVAAAILGAVLAVPVVTAPAVRAAEETVRYDISPEELQAIMQGAGFAAQIDSDEIGPYIASAASGINFYVGLDDCDEDEFGCTVLSFVSDSLAADDIEKIRGQALEWNNSTDWANWSRVSLDGEGRPSLVYSVSLNGGVTDGFIRVVLQDFVADIEDFRKSFAQ